MKSQYIQLLNYLHIRLSRNKSHRSFLKVMLYTIAPIVSLSSILALYGYSHHPFMEIPRIYLGIALASLISGFITYSYADLNKHRQQRNTLLAIGKVAIGLHNNDPRDYDNHAVLYYQCLGVALSIEDQQYTTTRIDISKCNDSRLMFDMHEMVEMTQDHYIMLKHIA